MLQLLNASFDASHNLFPFKLGTITKCCLLFRVVIFVALSNEFIKLQDVEVVFCTMEEEKKKKRRVCVNLSCLIFPY